MLSLSNLFFFFTQNEMGTGIALLIQIFSLLPGLLNSPRGDSMKRFSVCTCACSQVKLVGPCKAAVDENDNLIVAVVSYASGHLCFCDQYTCLPRDTNKLNPCGRLKLNGDGASSKTRCSFMYESETGLKDYHRI